LYTLADGHNPLGVSLGTDARHRIADLTRRFHLLIIEDDPYGLLQYDPTPPSAIRSLENEWVFYVGTFSKLLGPSLRVGWLVVPPDLMKTLSLIKEACDINTQTFGQTLVSDYLDHHSFSEYLARLRSVYRSKRDVMHQTLCEAFPPHCKWRIPSAGIYFWIELPDYIDAADVLRISIEQARVAFLPAAAFSRGRVRNGMRLCFSRSSPQDIVEGIGRLGAVLRNFC
jgi:2-aminoadipate transaminase